MKRGAIVISQELLKEILKGRMPDDFKLSGAEFLPYPNEIRLHGYSETFHEVIEGNLHMNEVYDDGGWKPQPLKIAKSKPWWKFWK